MTDIRRQVRSGTVVLGGMGLLAVALTACSSDPDKRCVDRDSYNAGKGYKVVSDKNCKSGTSTSGSFGKSRSTRADWYYDSDVSNGYADYGTFSRSEAVDRGGFGCSGSGSSGG